METDGAAAGSTALAHIVVSFAILSTAAAGPPIIRRLAELSSPPNTPTQAVTTVCLSHQPFPDAYAILPPRLPRVSSTVVVDRPPQPTQQHPTSTTDRRGVAFRSRSCLPTREMSELLRYSAPNNNNERACLLKPTPLCLPSRVLVGVGRRDRIARFGFWKRRRRRRRQFAAEATAASHH